MSRYVKKPGDWDCSACGNTGNFASRKNCKRCQSPKPNSSSSARGGNDPSESNKVHRRKHFSLEHGDWVCPKCFDNQFKRNSACRKCGEPKPEGVPAVPVQPNQFLPGDWLCPVCWEHQFAKNLKCFRCEHPRPERAGFERGRKTRKIEEEISKHVVCNDCLKLPPDEAIMCEHLGPSQINLEEKLANLKRIYEDSMPRAPPPSPIVERQQNDEEDDLCLICFERPRDASFVHGDSAHSNCCFACASQQDAMGRPCPTCRLPIEKVVKN